MTPTLRNARGLLVPLLLLGCATETTELTRSNTRVEPSSTSGSSGSGPASPDGASLGGASSTGAAGTAGSASGGTLPATGGDSNQGIEPVDRPCVDPAVATGDLSLIDDLEDRNHAIYPLDGRTGYWYVYNDGSGTQSPSPDSSGESPFAPYNDGHAPGQNGGYAARTWGSAFSSWGAGMGFDLNASGGRTCRYDARVYSGITFVAKGTASGLRLKLPTPATIPIDRGGRCVPGPNAQYDNNQRCDNAFGADVSLTPDWQIHTFLFSDLRQQQGWGIQAVFDASELVQVQFEVPAHTSFDFSVDDVEFF